MLEALEQKLAKQNLVYKEIISLVTNPPNHGGYKIKTNIYGI
jgi:hypothetical protein